LPEELQSAQRSAGLSTTPPPHLTVELRHRIGPLEIDVHFQLRQPWTILFGPSGSGKSTILRAIAGLLHPDSARIVCFAASGSAATLMDSSSRIDVPPHRRGTPLASQRATLFPHMSVLENLEYGAGSVGAFGKWERPRPLIANLPRLFHVEEVLEKRPAQLSGGEAQRVSLARAAMAGSQRILLLDEPFTGLDLPLRDSLLANLLAWQELFRTPILSVTHDVGEAFQLGAEVIKIAEGKVVQQGPVEVVLAEERAQLLRQLNGIVESPK
jgi:molybdate transport system ATP-binding protein